jgi:hypothetical protein
LNRTDFLPPYRRESIEDEVLSGLTAEEKATLRKLLTQALEGARVPATRRSASSLSGGEAA